MPSIDLCHTFFNLPAKGRAVLRSRTLSHLKIVSHCPITRRISGHRGPLGRTSTYCGGANTGAALFTFRTGQKTFSSSVYAMRTFPNRPRDIQQFLQNYPGTSDHASANANLNFYLDKQAMRPDRRTFEQFMQDTEGDYEELELNHGYIQWLFPIREHGVNPLAQPLQVHEAKQMADDPIILNRILRSYTMMLDFYGIDFNGGKLKLSKNYQDRFHNLSHRAHNLLRLTRILKLLNEIAPFQPHAAPLVAFFAAAHSEGYIDFAKRAGPWTRGESMDRWWSGCFRADAEREEVGKILSGRGEYGAGKWSFEEFGKWYDARVKDGKVGWTESTHD